MNVFTGMLLLLGFLIIAGHWAILAYRVAEFLCLRLFVDETYRVWLLPVAEIRSLITLPTISVCVAIIAGFGVNLATDDSRPPSSIALELLGISMGAVLLIGFLLAVADPPQSRARRLGRRLQRISSAMDDPVAPVGPVLLLRSEVAAVASFAAGHTRRSEDMRFIPWLRHWLHMTGMKSLLAITYGIPLVAVIAWVSSPPRSEFGSAGFFMVTGILAMAAGPYLQFANRRRRCLVYGRHLTATCDEIARKMKRFERRNASSLEVEPTTQRAPTPSDLTRELVRALYLKVRGRTHH